MWLNRQSVKLKCCNAIRLPQEKDDMTSFQVTECSVCHIKCKENIYLKMFIRVIAAAITAYIQNYIKNLLT